MIEIIRNDLLSLDQLDAIPPKSIFAHGVVEDGTQYFNYENGRFGDLRWVAVRGYIADWAIYVHLEKYPVEYVRNQGDKIITEKYIRYLVPCTDEVFARYRY